MTTEPRKPGWYWVKFRSETGGDWEALEFMGAAPSVGIEARWFHGSDEIEEWRFESIGPRIPTPDEPRNTMCPSCGHEFTPFGESWRD